MLLRQTSSTPPVHHSLRPLQGRVGQANRPEPEPIHVGHSFILYSLLIGETLSQTVGRRERSWLMAPHSPYHSFPRHDSIPRTSPRWFTAVYVVDYGRESLLVSDWKVYRIDEPGDRLRDERPEPTMRVAPTRSASNAADSISACGSRSLLTTSPCRLNRLFFGMQLGRA